MGSGVGFGVVVIKNLHIETTAESYQETFGALGRHYTVDNPKQLRIKCGIISIQSRFSKKDLGLVHPKPM